MKIYRLLLVTILLVMANNILNSQTIKILRNDVDSSRANFITAGHLFSIDILIDGLDSVSSASFDLNFTQANYISFSDAVHTDFGQGGRKPVVIHRVDTLNNQGNLYIGVIAADTLGGRGFDNPIVITLEFVVAPNAPNGLVTTFSFNKPQAVVSSGNIGELIKPLESESRDFIIHGYLQVWPGDADNDGEVTSMDVTQIGRYIGYGTSKHFQMRSFKRRNASTIWLPQYCMGWDSVEVTFADCDGNGDVTVTDQLIVAINFFKTHSGSTTNYLPKIKEIEDVEEIESDDPTGINYNYSDIYLKSDVLFYSASGTIKWHSTDGYSTVVGVERGDIFSESYFYNKLDENDDFLYHISNLQLNTNKELKMNGSFCRFKIIGNPDNIVFTNDIWGVDENDNIFKLVSFSDVDENLINSNDYDLNFKNGNLSIISNSNSQIQNDVKIYNLKGDLIDVFSFETSLNKKIELAYGVYVVIINNTFQKKLIIN